MEIEGIIIITVLVCKKGRLGRHDCLASGPDEQKSLNEPLRCQ